MSMAAVNAVYKLRRASPAEKAVLVFVASRLGKKQIAWPNQATISTATAFSKRTVIRALSDLERDGYIERSRRNRADGSRSSDVYNLLCIRDGFVECSIRTPNLGANLSLGAEADAAVTAEKSKVPA